MRKSEFWVALAGIVAAVGTAVLESGLLSTGSAIATIIGVVVIAATYVAGRSWEKAAKAKRPNVVFAPDSTRGDSNLARSIKTSVPTPP